MSSVNAITRSIDVASKEDGAVENVMKGIKAILHVFAAALENGDEQGWLTRLTDEAGQPFFTEEEAANLEPQLQPLADGLRSMAKGSNETQTGGGPDEMYESFLNAIDSVTQMVQGFARSSGTLQMELASDFKPDSHPFTPLGIPFGPTGMRIASEVPLPFRTLMFLTYLGLDVVRIFTSMPGFDMPFLRKTLSVIASAADILRGDWLKALLSFAGFFQASYVYMGFLGKVAVSIFSMVSPDLQEGIGWGTFSVLKSATMGFMLTCFQTFAPFELRQQVYTTFGQILNKKICEAEAVKEAMEGGSVTISPENKEKAVKAASRAVDNRLPTDSTLQRIQTAMAQPSSVCSDEVQQIIGVAQQNIFLRIALQLANIPTTPYALEKSCKKLYDYVGEKGHHDWKTLLMAEGMLDYLAPNRDKSGDDPSQQDKAKANMPHNKALQLKDALKKLEDEKKTLATDLSTAETDLTTVNNKSDAEYLTNDVKTLVQSLFPENTITQTFKEFTYDEFTKILMFVLEVEYKKGKIDDFKTFKEKDPYTSLTFDTIAFYTQVLYEILDKPEYELIHEKLFSVNRIINAIKRGEFGLIDSDLKSITENVKQEAAKKAHETAKADAALKIADLKRALELKDSQITAKTNELLAATTAMVDQVDSIAEQTEKTIAAAKGKELADKSKNQFTKSETKKAEEETAKKEAEEKRIEEEVQKRLSQKQSEPSDLANLPVPATPLGVATAMTKAVSNVLGRVGEGSSGSSSLATVSPISTTSVAATPSSASSSASSSSAASVSPGSSTSNASSSAASVSPPEVNPVTNPVAAPPIRTLEKIYPKTLKITLPSSLTINNSTPYVVSAGDITQTSKTNITGKLTVTGKGNSLIFTIGSNAVTIDDTTINGLITYSLPSIIKEPTPILGEPLIPVTGSATVELSYTVQETQKGGSRKRLQKGRRLTKRAKRS